MADDRVSPSETMMRAGWGAGIAVGMGVGVALGAALHNMGAGIAIGLGVGAAMMVAFTVAGTMLRRREAEHREDAADEPSADAGGAGPEDAPTG